MACEQHPLLIFVEKPGERAVALTIIVPELAPPNCATNTQGGTYTA